MGFFAGIKKKVATMLMGELITDLGALPIDDHGSEISLAIRRHPGRQPHVQVKLDSGEAHHFQILPHANGQTSLSASPRDAKAFERASKMTGDFLGQTNSEE